MDRSELLFRDGCRKWHAYFERCADDGRMAEIPHLIRKIAQYLDAWKESLVAARRETMEAERRVLECRQKEASVQLRLRMLGQLSVVIGRGFADRERADRLAKRRDAFAAEAERRAAAEEERKRRAEEERREKAERAERDSKIGSGGDNE